MSTRPSIRRVTRQELQSLHDPGAAEFDPPHVRLLDVARERFCRDGIHATGIDGLLAEAGVSKMTLYSRFGSKEALVQAALRHEGAAWRAQFVAVVQASGDTAASRLDGIAQALQAWFDGGRFYGCAFMNAVAEHSKGEAWLRALAAEHHGEIIAFLAGLAAAAGYAEPVLLARQVLLVIDGAIAAFLVTGDPAVLDLTRRNLRAVLASASDTPLQPERQQTLHSHSENDAGPGQAVDMTQI